MYHHYQLLLQLNHGTYRVTSGRAQAGYGGYCAQLAGVPEHLLKRAAQVSTSFARHEHIGKILHNSRSNMYRASIGYYSTKATTVQDSDRRV